MTDKEFKRLTRSELIDIIYEYQKQEKELKKEIAELEKKLGDRDLKLENVGSIAEATVELHGIFEAAQETANQYMQYVYAKTDKECAAKIKEAEEIAARIIAEAKNS